MGAAITANTGGTYSTISYNTLYNSGRELISGQLRNDQIVHNDVYDAMLQVEDGGAYYGTSNSNTVFAYNDVHDTLAIDGTGVGIYLDNGCSYTTIYDNLSYNNGYAMTLNWPSPYNLVYNNTLLGVTYSLSDWSGDGEKNMYGTVIENNIFTNTAYFINRGANYTASNNLPASTAPDFVNAAALNFQLQSSSAAATGGLVIPPATNGYVGATPGLGAFQYGLTPWTCGASNAFTGVLPADRRTSSLPRPAPRRSIPPGKTMPPTPRATSWSVRPTTPISR